MNDHWEVNRAKRVEVNRMQQKTDGRVVRLLTKHLGAEDRALEQWFPGGTTKPRAL